MRNIGPDFADVGQCLRRSLGIDPLGWQAVLSLFMLLGRLEIYSTLIMFDL
ncbi:MAG: hypothetical protein ACLFOA_04175 [Desulfohalobiaceae bacterium]